MKIAVITGANRGIGFEVCRQLARIGFTVVLTARDEFKGSKAAENLVEENLPVEFHQLDVTDEAGIEQLAHFIGEKFGKLDLLVNNAGIISNGKSISTASLEEIRAVIETNYFGPLMLSKALIPPLKKSNDARIINLSTGMGVWNDLNGTYAGYRLSKVGLNALTAMFANDLLNSKIKVNSVCPGWVRTEMGGPGAPRNVEQGADTITWLAEMKNIPTGKFFRNRKEISF
ncbi:MAG: SDR family oxidoreductase [Chitinophagales bacterium]